MMMIPQNDYIVIDFRKMEDETKAAANREFHFLTEKDKYLQVRYSPEFTKLYLRYSKNANEVEEIDLLEN